MSQLLKRMASCLACVVVACSHTHDPVVHAPNVFLVTLDTLRADHLGLYGYPRETAPFLTSLADQGTWFSHAIASCSHTAPAHASIFTSMTPMRHGVVANGQALREEFASMASLLGEAGYYTMAFTSVEFLKGIDPGFDEFYAGTWSDNAVTVVDRVLARMESWDSSQPLFIWVHLYDPHQPYRANDTAYFRELSEQPDAAQEEFMDFVLDEHGVPLSSFRKKQILEVFGDERSAVQVLMNKYDAEIRLADDQIQRLYESLTDDRFNHDARWVLLADHGEGLGNHGLHGHDRFLYQEQLRIPLIFHRASATPRKGRRVDQIVRQVDVLPTVLDWIGLSVDERLAAHWEGRSLVRFLNGGTLERPIEYAFSQRRYADPKFYWVKEEVFSIQSEQLKYIYHERSDDELYDLARDPLELRNLAGLDPARDAEMKAVIESRIAEWRSAGLPEPIIDGDGHRAELEALGYTDGS